MLMPLVVYQCNCRSLGTIDSLVRRQGHIDVNKAFIGHLSAYCSLSSVMLSLTRRVQLYRREDIQSRIWTPCDGPLEPALITYPPRGRPDDNSLRDKDLPGLPLRQVTWGGWQKGADGPQKQ
jgi:hypothetical protein